MAHVPHLLVTGPWSRPTLELDRDTLHHVQTVLRRSPGDPVTYTDGAGRFGTGTLGDGVVQRGDEHDVPAPTSVRIAVAPPASRDRARFIVEKLAELGVRELTWLRTRFGEGRPPPSAKVEAWCRSALAQSRGAWLLQISGPVDTQDLPSDTVFADAGGSRVSLVDAPCVAVGPEGGWAPGEIPADARVVSLSATVLRVETAALVAAVLAVG